MTAKPWTAEEIDRNEALVPKEDIGPVENVGWHSMCRAFATIRALQAEAKQYGDALEEFAKRYNALCDKLLREYAGHIGTKRSADRYKRQRDAFWNQRNRIRDEALKEIRHFYERNRALQAEIRELKTPSGYWDGEGSVIWKPDTTYSNPAITVADLEDMLYQELVDDGDTVTFTPYHELPPETYIVRWVPDADDPDMRRVKLERVEQSQHPIGDLHEEAK